MLEKPLLSCEQCVCVSVSLVVLAAASLQRHSELTLSFGEDGSASTVPASETTELLPEAGGSESVVH